MCEGNEVVVVVMVVVEMVVVVGCGGDREGWRDR